ncbi:UNVERIFIED_CONTAM: hypothetical protein GTU68_018440 [Idotea baltica]|nr:hypothetical protein [Idotea baltica]
MLDTFTDLRARLKDPELLAVKSYIDGAWVDADSGATFKVVNPARGDVVAEVADLGRAEVARAIAAAEAAQKGWAKLAAKERSSILRRWFNLMMEAQDDLAAILTAEMGKPLAEAKGEIGYGASFVEFFAEEAKRIYGETIPGHMADKRITVIKQPIGVVGSITPWNFPNAMITRKAAPALAAGCAFVARPADLTPLSATALAVLAERAGIPAGVFSVVTGSDASAIGKEFCENPIVRKLTFTGSTQKAVTKVEDHIKDALDKGAEIVMGGKPHDLGGLFFEPTILTGVTQDMKVANEETFGPMAPLFRFTDEDEVIDMANDTIFGLAAYFYANDLSRVYKVAEALEYGIVGINTGIISTEMAPFGGVKQSGLGREGSHHGIEEYLEMKYMCMSV